jgi:hypothetical protein
MQASLVNGFVYISHAPARCKRCRDEIGEPTPPHIVEAYEETGEILCEDCWTAYLEEDQEKP